MPLGERLRKLRIANGMTQQDVADVLGLERSTYANYETDSTKPSIENLCALARLFRTSPDVLTNYSRASYGGPAIDGAQATEAGFSVDAERLSRLSRDEKHVVLLYRMSENKDEILKWLTDNAVTTKEN